ncbi:MAG UNVERIFIED_CONTAM: hypothetical protein LVQ98_07690, partial [Rickettsiaceae bacterium]
FYYLSQIVEWNTGSHDHTKQNLRGLFKEETLFLAQNGYKLPEEHYPRKGLIVGDVPYLEGSNTVIWIDKKCFLVKNKAYYTEEKLSGYSERKLDLLSSPEGVKLHKNQREKIEFLDNLDIEKLQYLIPDRNSSIIAEFESDPDLVNFLSQFSA